MLGMSQEQLATEAMMSRSHLSAIKAPNIVRPFSEEVLFRMLTSTLMNDILSVVATTHIVKEVLINENSILSKRRVRKKT